MWKSLARSVVYRTRWIELIGEKFVTSRGAEVDYTYLKTKGSVHIVPVDRDGRIILMETYRPTIGKFMLEIPAGALVDAGDGVSPETHALRELKEEIGGTCRELVPLGNFYLLNGVANVPVSYFLALDVELGEAQPEETEVIRNIKSYEPAEVLRMIQAGQVEDGDSVLGLMLALQYEVFATFS